MKTSELATRHFPEPVRDLIAAPLAHDTAAEIAQTEIRDWIRNHPLSREIHAFLKDEE